MTQQYYQSKQVLQGDGSISLADVEKYVPNLMGFPMNKGAVDQKFYEALQKFKNGTLNEQTPRNGGVSAATPPNMLPDGETVKKTD
jgi:hypothetical protein